MIRFLKRLLGPRAAVAPVPGGWAQMLRDLPHWELLDEELRARLQARVAQFLAEKAFVGCGGLALAPRMRVTVAALACLLILRPQAQVFPRLRAVLLYPDAFLVPPVPDEAGFVDEAPHERIGESWGGDRVILSWPEVERALAGDAVNVVAHEFAHQLDDHKAGREGAPESVNAARWAQVMREEYERLQRHRRPPVLDPYGAESPAEFFAVATEAYFQRGMALQRHHPALYELLRDYYRIETARLPYNSADTPT